MRLFITTILIIFFAAIAELLSPWWSIALVSFVFGFMTDLQKWKAFIAGFAGIGLLWLAEVFWIDVDNGHILSEKLAVLFHLPHYSLMILIASLLGAMVGGMSAWSGILARKMFLK